MPRQRRRKARVGVSVPVASMGDIAFLLIAFFVLASQFAKDLPVELAESIDIEVLQDIPPVSVVVDNEQRIYVDGEEVEGDGLEAIVVGKVQAIQPEAARRILFKSDKVNQHADLEPIYEALAKAGVPIALGGAEIENQSN